MSDLPERPKRKAAIEARARLHEQAEVGRRRQYYSREQDPEVAVLNEAAIPVPMTRPTPRGAQLAVAPGGLPRPPTTRPSTDIPRLPTGRGPEMEPRQEDETLPPVPSSIQVPGSPEYILDKKLGKGGFGQVYLGQRAIPTRIKDGPQANSVAIKLEHKNSKGCSYGPPYEWNVYK